MTVVRVSQNNGSEHKQPCTGAHINDLTVRKFKYCKAHALCVWGVTRLNDIESFTDLDGTTSLCAIYCYNNDVAYLPITHHLEACTPTHPLCFQISCPCRGLANFRLTVHCIVFRRRSCTEETDQIPSSVFRDRSTRTRFTPTACTAVLQS